MRLLRKIAKQSSLISADLTCGAIYSESKAKISGKAPSHEE